MFFWYFAVLRAVPGKREKIDVLGSYAGINVTGLYIPKPIFFDIIAEDLKSYLAKKPNFDCYFKVKKDTYSNKIVMDLEDIH